MNIKERIVNCLEENGIVLDEDGNMSDLDSISFVKIVVAIEEEFDIEIPEEVLIFERLNSVDKLLNIISSVTP